MFSYLEKIKEEYIQNKIFVKVFLWLIKRKANDGVRQILDIAYFFSVYLWTDLS